jgi:adenylate cyclase
MSSINVWPDDIDVNFDPDANLLETLVDAGIPIDHLCGGRGRCSTCRVLVLEGLEQLSARTAPEVEMATKLDLPEVVRLACQTTLNGSVSLRRLVLDKTDERLASQLGRPELGGAVGKEVDIAALFVDVVGYTKMAEDLPPYDIVHVLNRFFRQVGEVVATNEGVIDNYMGDAVLALFGLHDESEPAMAAVRAGFGILDAAKDLSHYVQRIYRMRFTVRVGIDFGEVVFGLMGASGSARETVIGDAVNVASRLESANKDVGTDMLVSDAVYQRTAHEVGFGQRYELDLRGKTGRVVAHEATSLRSSASG